MSDQPRAMLADRLAMLNSRLAALPGENPGYETDALLIAADYLDEAAAVLDHHGALLLSEGAQEAAGNLRRLATQQRARAAALAEPAGDAAP